MHTRIAPEFLLMKSLCLDGAYSPAFVLKLAVAKFGIFHDQLFVHVKDTRTQSCEFNVSQWKNLCLHDHDRSPFASVQPFLEKRLNSSSEC